MPGSTAAAGVTATGATATVAPAPSALKKLRRSRAVSLLFCDIVVSSGKKKEDRTEAAPDQASKADQRKANAEKRAQLAPLKKKINEIESLTAKLEKMIQALDTELADPALYEKAPAKAAQKVKERGEAAAKLSDAEEQWLMLSGEYEEAMAG